MLILNDKLLDAAKEILENIMIEEVVAIGLNNEPILDKEGLETNKVSINISIIINRSVAQYKTKEEDDGNYYTE